MLYLIVIAIIASCSSVLSTTTVRTVNLTAQYMTIHKEDNQNTGQIQKCKRSIYNSTQITETIHKSASRVVTCRRQNTQRQRIAPLLRLVRCEEHDHAGAAAGGSIVAIPMRLGQALKGPHYGQVDRYAGRHGRRALVSVSPVGLQAVRAVNA